MTTKEALHQLVDRLADEDAAEVLAYLQWLTSDSEALSDEELTIVRMGEDEIARGEYVTLDDLARSLRG